MKIIKIIILGVLGLILSGCMVSNNKALETSTPQKMPTVSLEPFKPVKPTVSPTLLFASPTASPTTRPLFETKCLNLITRAEKNELLTGNLILYPRVKDAVNGNGMYILNLKTKEKFLLPKKTDIVSTPVLSPDFIKIAYNTKLEGSKNKYLYIISHKREVVKIMELTGDLGSFWRWENDYQVIISQKRNPDDYDKGALWFVYSYNLMTNNKDLFQIPLLTGNPGGFAVDLVLPNSEMTYVIIYWKGDRPGIESKSGYEILDINQYKSTFVYGLNTRGLPEMKYPIWYDDNHVVLAMIRAEKEELYMVDMEGNAKQITHMGDYFDYFDITHWTLSPDKQKLGFYAYAWKDNIEKSSLFVMDLGTGIITDTCLQGDEIRNADKGGIFSSTGFYGPVWSPDSQHLLFESRYEEEKSRLYWIDLLNNVAIPIAENTFPVAWMAEPE